MKKNKNALNQSEFSTGSAAPVIRKDAIVFKQGRKEDNFHS